MLADAGVKSGDTVVVVRRVLKADGGCTLPASCSML